MEVETVVSQRPKLTSAEWRRLPRAEKERLRALKRAERRAKNVVSLPVYPKMERSPFRTAGGVELPIHNLYAGASVFIVCGGPSVKSLDVSLLHRRGIVTIGTNNAAAALRTRMFIHVDPPQKFHHSLWLDAGIQKFVPTTMANRHLRRKLPDGSFTPLMVGSAVATPAMMPNTIFYKRAPNYDPDRFLGEPIINWGTSKKWHKQTQRDRLLCVFPAVLKLAYALGFRQVFLLGADFHMAGGEPDKPADSYFFEQSKLAGQAHSNNGLFRKLIPMMEELRPRFDAAGFKVWNCNPASNLTAFPFVGFREAVEMATVGLDQDPLSFQDWYVK